MKDISLRNWSLVGTLPFQAEFTENLRKGGDMPYMVAPVPATVPGCVYDDLWRAGVIENPYMDLNSLNVEWVANRWWIYRADFTVEEADLEKALHLTLHGVDYKANVYVNGTKAGEIEGMYRRLDLIVNEYVTVGENKLVIVLEHAPDTFGQAGYTSRTHHLKARFNYKWDFAGRIVSLGLYEPVTLTARDGAYLTDLLIQTKSVGKSLCKCENAFEVTASVDVNAVTEGTYTVTLSCEGEQVAQTEVTVCGKQTVTMQVTKENVDLWWPNGSGEQPIYMYNVTVCKNGEVCDTKDAQVGFRTMEHQKVDGFPNALDYQIVVNGKRIYRKGTNIVPLTDLTGALTDEQLEGTLKACKEANINFLRIWGGGHFESEKFYNLADRLGLMVLQEFPESSSGCDDLPSRDEHFLALLDAAAPGQIKRIATHPSFCEFDGGNEMEDFKTAHQPDHEMYAATFDDPILQKFKAMIEENAPGSYMLPASGSGFNTVLKDGSDPQRNHDVHGPWKYMGPVNHYSLYNNNRCIIHGEFGCGGITNFESMKEFLSGDNLKFNVSLENRVWHHHGGAGWDGYFMTIQPMFGNLRNIPFDDYIALNQYMQYEGLRYSLEAHRSREWNTVGTMTWQFNEPWPNVECSNVYDFYGRKKLGFYALQEAYAPVTMAMQYDKFFWEPGDVFETRFTALNDFDEAMVEMTASITSIDGSKVYATQQISGMAKGNLPTAMGKMQWTVPDGMKEGFVVRLSGKMGETAVEKQYLMVIADKPAEALEIPAIISAVVSAMPKSDYGKFAEWSVVSAYAKKLRETYIE